MGLKENVASLNKVAEGGGGNVTRWKPGAVNKIVLLPGFMSDGKFVEKPFVKRGVHFNAPNGEIVNCPKNTLDKPCRLCEAYFDAKNGDGNPEDLETCKPRQSFTCLIVDMNDKAAGVQVWEAGWSCFQQLMELVSDDTVYDSSSPVAWMAKNPVIQFKKKGSKLTTEYTAFRPTGKVIRMPLKKYKAAGLPDLKKLAMSNVPSYEDTCRAYEGHALRKKPAKKIVKKSK